MPSAASAGCRRPIGRPTRSSPKRCSSVACGSCSWSRASRDNIDRYGLDEIDNKILLTIIDKFRGGPVGVSTIATAIGEDSGTVEEVYEPFLIMEGFIKRTPRGRMATPLAYEHLGRNPYTSNIMQGDLFE